MGASSEHPEAILGASWCNLGVEKGQNISFDIVGFRSSAARASKRISIQIFWLGVCCLGFRSPDFDLQLDIAFLVSPQRTDYVF